MEKFRSDRKRLPLHPLEKAVLTVVTLHLCFLPWALGTMHVWSQITSLLLALAGMVLALWPRTYSGDYALPVAGNQSPVTSPPSTSPVALRQDESRRSLGVGGRPQISNSTVHRPPSTAYRLIAWPRLVRFPIFWIGLTLLAYITIQGFNPSWVWTHNATTWWLVRVNDIEWLPTSIDTPFERFNLWRQFIIYASGWLTVCTVWVGITRRRSLHVLLTAVILNATGLALLGFVQRFSASPKFLFLWEWPLGHTAFASFIYRNHAGSYFALATMVAIALAIWINAEGERSGRKSTPAGALVLVAVLLSTAVFFSLSRGASLILSGAWLTIALWFWLYWRQQPARQTVNPIVSIMVPLLLLTVVGGTIRYLDFSSVEVRFHSLFTNYLSADDSVRPRLLAHEAAENMLNDNWPRGVGAGGFQYLYPEYIKDIPDIYHGGHWFWEHAHSDWLEIPIELGAVGVLLLVLGAGYWLHWFWRHQAFWHALAIPVLLGCAQTLAHAWFDFPFQCPAILTTWLALLAVCARWTELDGL